MRLMFILLTACLLDISAVAQAPVKITFSGKNVDIKKVFAAIKTQTGYVVLFSRSALDNAKPVSLSVTNIPLTDFLDMVLKEQPLTYRIEDKTIMVFKKNGNQQTVDLKSGINDLDTSQKINIHGRIVNEKGDWVIATITVKGTANAVSSNANGEFVLTRVDKNATLLITSINMEEQEVQVNGRSDLKTIIVKTKIKEEGEIVIANTGYQKIKPNEVTGSVVLIDNKTLNQQTGTNIIDRLNGVTPGMLFNVGKKGPDGFTPNLYSIRGLNTINGNISPLIILDNFQFDGDINNINPGDVENITILKDAAAASIYGALGGNGVIVITTKRGRFNQKLKVEMNADMIVTQKPDLYAIPQLSSSEYIYLEEYYFNKNVDFGANNTDFSPVTPVINILMKRKAGTISAADSAFQLDALKKIDYRDDLNKYIYQDAITRQYSLNLRGGSNNLAWLISGSYDKNISNLDDKSDKVNLKFLNEYKPVKNLNISFSAYYTNASSKTGKVLPTIFRQSPYIQLADENGTPLVVPIYRLEYVDTVGVDTTGTAHLLNWKKYPLEDYKHDITTTRREQLIASLEARYTILKGLDLSLNYQYQRQWGNSERYADIESYYARDFINTFTRLSRTSAPDTFNLPKGGILEVKTNSENSYNIRAQLGFQRDWQQRKHFVNAIVAAERREMITEPGTEYTLYGYNKDPLTQAKVNYTTEYPTFLSGASRSLESGAPRIGPLLNSHFISLLGNATYTYKQRYSLSASARKDAANIFGLNTNNKWTPLWSAGLAWDLSAEKFYPIKTIPYLKLKFTYGYSGNVDLSKTALLVLTYSSSFNTPYGTSFADPSRRNADLRWEKKRDFNIAIEFATKKNIISGSIEYYEKKCTDLYGQTLYDYTTQYTFGPTIQGNIANTKGNGVDISITSRNLDKKIKWSTTLIFNYNKDIVTDYFSPTGINGSELVYYDGSNITPVVGKPLYAIAAMKWGGLDSTGKPQGYYEGKLRTNYQFLNTQASENGLNSSTLEYIGPATPPVFGSFINTISWKGLSVNINILYSFGYYFRKPIFSQTTWRQNGTGYGEFSNRWQKKGDELITTVPALIPPDAIDIDDRSTFYANSSINVLKADHVRLHYINLSYSYTRRQRPFPFSYIQVYVNLSNLGILWRANNQKIDPLYPASIPPSKSFTIGLRTNL